MCIRRVNFSELSRNLRSLKGVLAARGPSCNEPEIHSLMSSSSEKFNFKEYAVRQDVVLCGLIFG